MNERLKELMLEAGYAAPEIAGRANKLAELIVEECGRVADVFCDIWCEEDKPQDVTVSNYIKRHVLRTDPE